MKNICLVIFIILCSRTFCQSVDPCGSLPPLSYISNKDAYARINLYRNDVKNAFKTIANIDELDSIVYTKNEFLDLLKNLAASTEPDKNDPKGEFDGFRIYFAMYPAQLDPAEASDNPENKKDCLTLVYVPTKKGFDNKDAHLDQVTNCYIYTGKGFKKIDCNKDKTPIKWIYNYRLYRMALLDKYSNVILNKGIFSGFRHRRFFYETESLWYEKALVSHPTQGLIAFLECPGSHVDLIKANFACYTERETPVTTKRAGGVVDNNPYRAKQPKYQLTLILGLQTSLPLKNGLGGTYNSNLVLIGDLGKHSKKKGTPGDKNTDTDTAKPCPPPNDPGACNTQGAILPNQQ